jgi:hypothetical protein
MTSDLDADLRLRLARLAAAVPVTVEDIGSRPLATVQGTPPRTRLASGAAFSAVAVALVILVAAGILVSRGSPSGSLLPSTASALPSIEGPAVATDRMGDYELTIRSAKGRYALGETVDIEATLSYLGSEHGVVIRYDRGARGGPMAFGIEEPVPVPGLGLMQLQPEYRECGINGLRGDHPLAASFAKSGALVATATEPPEATVQSYLLDQLTLPEGVWHPYVIARFSVRGCGVDEIDLRADIEIRVDGPAPLPSGTQGPESGQSSSDVDGDFALTLRSERSSYLRGEPIVVTAFLTYTGSEPEVDIAHDSAGPVRFEIREPLYGADVMWNVSRLMCGHSTLVRDVPSTIPFRKAGGYSNHDPAADALHAFFSDQVLRLPAGTWHLRAIAGIGPCMGLPSPGAQMDVEIVITVVD